MSNYSKFYLNKPNATGVNNIRDYIGSYFLKTSISSTWKIYINALIYKFNLKIFLWQNT